MKVSLIALKNFSYGRLRIKCLQKFSAARSDARILIAIGYASRDDSSVEVGNVVADEDTKRYATGKLDRLRSEFLSISGVNPDRRWGIARITSEISNFKSEAEKSDE